MTRSTSAAEDAILALLEAQDAKLTLGGEPTYVPVDPVGMEWAFTAVGPTKLTYTYALGEALIALDLPGAITFYSPGKSYPGETNPRWVVSVLANRDGSPVLLPQQQAAVRERKPSLATAAAFRESLAAKLNVISAWLPAKSAEAERVWVLPLDHSGGEGWQSAKWGLRSLTLVPAEGPAGLRLPLNRVPAGLSRRALTLTLRDGRLELFLPPLLQEPFAELLAVCGEILRELSIQQVRFQGYLPSDETDRWVRIGLASDPGVLEVNLPPCGTWGEYRDYLGLLEAGGAQTNLRSFKIQPDGTTVGTGGGNHLVFGGPSLAENPFFTRPGWVTSILRYFQRHPSLAYLFTGAYVGPSSQAPRPDESARDLYDLEMAYQFLESLPEGDHRSIISETLRHLHIDGTGNTHRSEISFDKFWNTRSSSGSYGLIEFRAIETLPRAEWMAAVMQLWQAILVRLLAAPFREPLLEFHSRLHDEFFLPSFLWADLDRIFADLAAHKIALGTDIYGEIWQYRFPLLLEYGDASASGLTVRRALEGWPLLSETPDEGGTTSRFVDTSMDRLEFAATSAFDEAFSVFVQGRELGLTAGHLDGKSVAGLRYRRTALYPSLHPGIPPQMPLLLEIVRRATGETEAAFQLELTASAFTPIAAKTTDRGLPCRKAKPDLLTYDLRLPD